MIRARPLISVMVVAAVATATARAQNISRPPPEPALTIDQAVREALDRNLNLLAERFNVKVADAAIVTASLRPNPVVTVNVAAGSVAGRRRDQSVRAGVPDRLRDRARRQARAAGRSGDAGEVGRRAAAAEHDADADPRRRERVHRRAAGEAESRARPRQPAGLQQRRRRSTPSACGPAICRRSSCRGRGWRRCSFRTTCASRRRGCASRATA